MADVTWTNATPFDLDHVAAVPKQAGVLVLSIGGEADVWVEATPALRARVSVLLELSHDDEPALARVLDRAGLRLRCAPIDDVPRRAHVARSLRERLPRAEGE